MGCINRDKNTINNMIKIIKSYLIDKTRIEKYMRCYKFSEIIKESYNPNSVSVKYDSRIKRCNYIFSLLYVSFFSEKCIIRKI